MEDKKEALRRIARAEKISVERMDYLQKLIQGLSESLFNPASPPVEASPRFTIMDRPVCTPGNLTTILAQAKAGKSAFVGAMIAAKIAVENGIQNCDTLGVTASNDGGYLLHFDTEQSPADHHNGFMRNLERARHNYCPPWVYSYRLAGRSASEQRDCIEAAIFSLKYSKIHSIFIDGVADLVLDVNDAEECNGLVSRLHGLAIRYECPIICILHENPGTEKARGHLGSQLERKSESNLRLKKTEDVTTVFSVKQRRAPILEKDGPRFSWDTAAGMHLSVSTASGSPVHELAAEIFAGGALRYGEMIKKIAAVSGCSDKTAERKYVAMKNAGVILKDGVGLWRMKT